MDPAAAVHTRLSEPDRSASALPSFVEQIEEELREMAQLYCMAFEIARLSEDDSLARVMEDACLLAFWHTQSVAVRHRFHAFSPSSLPSAHTPNAPLQALAQAREPVALTPLLPPARDLRALAP